MRLQIPNAPTGAVILHIQKEKSIVYISPSCPVHPLTCIGACHKYVSKVSVAVSAR